MFTNCNLRNFQESIIRTSTMAITINIIQMFIIGNDKFTFDETWLIVTLAKIIGFGAYDLFLYRIVDDSKFNINEKGALKDILYFGGMLYIKEHIVSKYFDKDLNPKLLKNLTLVVIGFTIYHLFVKERIQKITSHKKRTEVNKNTNKELLSYASKLLFGIYIIDVIPYIENRNAMIQHMLPTLFVLSLSIPIYFLIVRKLLKF